MNGRARAVAWLAVAALALALCAAVVRLAWLSDDAYITLRSVENLLRGHGPVWNVGERVQTFTHPLWFWLVAAARAVTGEHYFTTIWLSVALAMAAVLLLVRRAGPVAGAAALCLCLASRAFGDYATSGLETPLVMLLVVLLALADQDGRGDEHGRRLGRVALLTGLLGTTRLDLLVLAAPVLLARVLEAPPGRRVRPVALGLAPLAAWSAFAAFYYGSPFPITAYAKAFCPGVPSHELLAQGWRYVVHTASHDPATMAVIAAGIALGIGVRSLHGRALAMGAVLSCLYVVKVGGDFMAGRFFVPAFTAALCLCARALRRAPRGATFCVVASAVVLAWLPGRPPCLSPPSADLDEGPIEHGIRDERRFYFRGFGLCSPQREIPEFGRFTTALRRQGRERTIVLGSGMAGGIPFLAGEGFHFVDPWLCDPLLMRLPALDPANWRIGHFTRGLPEGYLETVAFDRDLIVDDGLRLFAARLRVVTRDPLWSGRRLGALGASWFGGVAAELDGYVERAYRNPQRMSVAPAGEAGAPPPGTFWFDDLAVKPVGRGGLRVALDAPVRASRLRLCASPLAVYRFTFFAGEQEVGRAALPALLDPGVPPADASGDVLGYLRRFAGTHDWTLPLAADLPAFDRVHVDCDHEPWIVPAVGALWFEP